MVQDWKLFTMAQAVLHAVFDNAEETIQIAEGILGKEIIDTEQEDVLRGKSDIEEKLKKERDRYNMLLEMRMNNEISKEVFYTKSEEVENKIGELESSLLQYQNIQEVTEEDMTDKLSNLSKLLAQGVELENGEFSKSAIDKYVYGVKVTEDSFE